MAFETCHYQTPCAGVGVITLNRPKALNAINKTMTKEVEKILDEAAADESIRALILTGSGPAFCAGGDLSWLMQADDKHKKREIVDRAGALISTLWSMQKPVLAAVNGVAAGAGTAMVLACDLSIAADSARFAPNFVNIAAVPDSGASWFLPRVVGMHRAMDLMVSGRTLKAQEALDMGIFGRVVPADSLQQAALEWGQRIARGPQGAIRSIKAMLKASMANDLQEHLEEEAVRQVQAWSDPDFQEGVAAFVHKRKPSFA